MRFDSFDFIIFLVVVLMLVRAAGPRLRNWILLVASLFFYGWWDWRYLGLFGFNCFVAWQSAIRIADAPDPRSKHRWCAAGVIACTALLCYFKYRGFFFENVTAALARMGWMESRGTLQVVLPVGISFFTFQAIAYIVDVYRGTTQACRNVPDFILFKAFFPQLIAGPIERANNLLPQIQKPRAVTNSDVIEGLYLVLWGYCKKVVIADNLALKINSIYNLSEFTAGDVFIAALGFTFQAYGDFSGYTDIARGIARWFGVNLMQNFNFPYLATSPQDFWRRWHISLGSWLREYLYIPLGGNRRGAFRTWLNLIITMLIGGIWHGPAWNYVVWGAYQGMILSLHRAYVAWRGEHRHSHLSRTLCIGGNLLLTLYGMLIFRLASWDQICAATSAIFACEVNPGFAGKMIRMLPYIGLILLVEMPVFLSRTPWFWVRSRRPIFIAAVFLFLFYCILILGVTGGAQFIYFAF